MVMMWWVVVIVEIKAAYIFQILLTNIVGLLTTVTTVKRVASCISLNMIMIKKEKHHLLITVTMVNSILPVLIIRVI